MSEYQYVEKPFLDQLSALGWKVIDQGTASEGTNEPAVIAKARKYAKEVEAVENFKRAFNKGGDEKFPYIALEHIEERKLRLNGIGHSDKSFKAVF